MQCKDIRNQFADYLIGAGAESVRAEVENHLSSCPDCRREAEGLEAIWMKLGSIPAEAPDTAGMRAKFNVMIEAYEQAQRAPEAAPEPQPPKKRTRRPKRRDTEVVEAG